jgi:hypothetical protein
MRPRRHGRVVAVARLAGLLALGGCSVATGLEVRYPEAGAKPALLASVAPGSVAIGPVVDRRMDTTRIGADRDGKTDIVTSASVAVIVREALAVELAKNGLAASAPGGDAVLAADVEEFWLDRVSGYPAAQYVGRVALAVAVTDAHTGDVVVTRRYTGIRRQRADGDSESVRRDVMNAALARTMRDLATDPVLVSALGQVASGR